MRNSKSRFKRDESITPKFSKQGSKIVYPPATVEEPRKDTSNDAHTPTSLKPPPQYFMSNDTPNTNLKMPSQYASNMEMPTMVMSAGQRMLAEQKLSQLAPIEDEEAVKKRIRMSFQLLKQVGEQKMLSRPP